MSDPCQFVIAEINGGATPCAFPSIAGAGPTARCEQHYLYYMLERAAVDHAAIISLLEQILAKP